MHTSVFSLMSVGLFVATAGAQVSVTSQSRFISGQSINTLDGVPTDSGVQQIDSFPGDFGTWAGSFVIPGNFLVSGEQLGGFNGSDTIEVTNFTMNISGGGGPGSAGWGTLRNHFEMAFDVASPVDYVLNGAINMGPGVTVAVTLSGPGTSYSASVEDGSLVTDHVSGTMQPGSYTFVMDGSGTLEFTGPGGNGSGAGGTPQPMYQLIMTAPAGCPVDLDSDGDFSNGGTPDGGVDINDLLYFLTGFESGSAAVDLDNGSGDGVPDGGVDINDLLFFLVHFELGC